MGPLIVVGSSLDPHINGVLRHLRVLADLEILCVDLTAPIVLNWRAGAREVSLGNATLARSGDSPPLVWWRDKGSAVLRSSKSEHLFQAYKERRVCVSRALEMLGVRWFNPRYAVDEASNKLRQLGAARDLGWAVPDTIISSDFQQVIDFVTQRPSVMKAAFNPNASSCAQCGTRPLGIATSRITAADVLDAAVEEVALAPMIFQAEIEKAYEVRLIATKFGALAYKVDSQASAAGQLDWRLAQFENIFSPMDVGSDIVASCHEFLAQLGIPYGSFDFIVDRVGQWWFLECNPEGQWAWLESDKDDRPISLMVAEAIHSTLAA